MSEDYPQLSLDDLVHIMSPSPAPQTLLEDSESISLRTSPSPEPLCESDIVHMRKRAVKMRHVGNTDAQLTPREKELAEMVLRLIAFIKPDSDQLLRQADVISALIQHRDMLLRQSEEQLLRWNSEKDGWARMAEALLAQHAKTRINSERDEDLERLHAAETDNRSLRQRLNETQSRLQILESELTRLRPLLLMQPLISRSSMFPPTPDPKGSHSRRRRKEKEPSATEDEGHGPSEDEIPLDPFDNLHSQVTPKPKARKSEAPTNAHPSVNQHKRRPSQKSTLQSASADARVEHLLLAARKIGKHRAGILSGMVQHLDERERERRREESATVVASTPKTPKRNTSQMGYSAEAGYVYLNSQMRRGQGLQSLPAFIPTCHHHILQTPSSSTTAPSIASSAHRLKQNARTNNPQTPLDSLLSAARSMMREDIDGNVDEDEEVDVVGDSPKTGSRHARSGDMLGSPVPKRRKIVAGNSELPALKGLTRSTDDMLALSVETSEATSSGAGRVRSALDVLADQAAAFSTQEQFIPQLQTEAVTPVKGKGKDNVDMKVPGFSSSSLESRRTRSRKRSDRVDSPSSVERTSRSRTPRSDLGDDSTGDTRRRVDEHSPEAQADPGGGEGNTNIPNTSQTLDSTAVSERSQLVTNNYTQCNQSRYTPPLDVDDSTDATQIQGHVQGIPREEELTEALQPDSEQLPSLMPEIERHDAPSPPPHTETTPFGGNSGGGSGSGPTLTTAPPTNKELARVAEQDTSTPAQPTKRQRSPYVKWSKEEDDLLAQAVAKYGQKWDLVQKALPSRGYHQVRQRWLRKLGVFDSKPDLSSFQTAATTLSSASRDGIEPRGNPKLGLAPLSSEKAFSGLRGRPPSLPS